MESTNLEGIRPRLRAGVLRAAQGAACYVTTSVEAAQTSPGETDIQRGALGTTSLAVSEPPC